MKNKKKKEIPSQLLI